MKDISKFKKLSVEELKDTWKKVASDSFTSFEEYVAEVRKVESDLHAGWITQEELNAENDERFHGSNQLPKFD